MEKFLLKGINGILKIYEDRVILSRNTVRGVLYQGFKGEKVYFFKDLAGIQYKKPNLLVNGYIKFIVAGTNEKEINAGLFGLTNSKSVKDPNTLILVSSEKVIKDGDKMYQYMLEQMEKIKNDNSVKNDFSSADEIRKFKELLDDGIITQEEFEKKKKELL